MTTGREQWEAFKILLRHSVRMQVAVLCLALLGVGYYLEYIEGLEPCPLCQLQRLALLMICMTCLAAMLHIPGVLGRRFYSGLALVFAVPGALTAAWQVRLQRMPGEAPECGPGLAFILESFPLSEALKMIFFASGECAEVSWTFLSLSIAEWSLFWFLVLTSLLVAHTFARHPL